MPGVGGDSGVSTRNSDGALMIEGGDFLDVALGLRLPSLAFFCMARTRERSYHPMPPYSMRSSRHEKQMSRHQVPRRARLATRRSALVEIKARRLVTRHQHQRQQRHPLHRQAARARTRTSILLQTLV